jgi:hypothetical protein
MVAGQSSANKTEPLGSLASALVFGAAAVPPFWATCAMGVDALDPRGDTAPAALTVLAVIFFAPGAALTWTAASALKRSGLYRWVTKRADLAYLLVAIALMLVIPAFVRAATVGPGDSSGWLDLALVGLAGIELSIGLTWLIAWKRRAGAAAVGVLPVFLVISVIVLH